MSKIKFNTILKREILVKCKNESNEKTIATLIHDQLHGNPDYINNKIVLTLSKDYDSEDNTLSLCIFKDCENIPDIRLTDNNYILDYIDSIIIKCYKDDAKRLRESLYNQIYKSKDYIEQNISLIDCYDRKNDTIDEIHLIYNKPCKDLSDIIIEGEFNTNKNKEND